MVGPASARVPGSFRRAPPREWQWDWQLAWPWTSWSTNPCPRDLSPLSGTTWASFGIAPTPVGCATP
eukprot:10188946-Lingulodinium_polyedra.AAC.1